MHVEHYKIFEQTKHEVSEAKYEPVVQAVHASEVWLYVLQFVIIELAKHELELAKK